jgi:hypothetical protein
MDCPLRFQRYMMIMGAGSIGGRGFPLPKLTLRRDRRGLILLYLCLQLDLPEYTFGRIWSRTLVSSRRPLAVGNPIIMTAWRAIVTPPIPASRREFA